MDHRLSLHTVVRSAVSHREFHGLEYHSAQIPLNWEVIRDKSSHVTTEDLRSQPIKDEVYTRSGNEGTKW